MHAPQIWLGEEIKAKIWEDVEGLVQKYLEDRRSLQEVNFMCVENCYRHVHLGYGFEERNNDDKAILNFTMWYGDMSSS